MDRFSSLLNEFNHELRVCQQIYSRSAAVVAFQHNHLIDQTSGQFIELMQDLHRGLLLKLFVSIARVDNVWSVEEEKLANVLVYHLWQQQLTGKNLRDSIRNFIPYAESLDWRHLIQPFREYRPLEAEIPNLETLIVRIGNLIAKADGHPTAIEMDCLRQIQQELLGHLYLKETRDLGTQRESTDPFGADSQSQKQQKFPGDDSNSNTDHLASTIVQDPAESAEQALMELEELVGLESVKAEVKQLINFIKVQQLRSQQGLSETPLSLHMVFGGNPGSGKTTVARILGRIYGALGILDKGHLVETDRSGLVAEYAGQTGPKTNKVIDSALDGILFIDEAYSLVADSHEDPYGREAVQALVKRMEDDRQRLIVILAGYPNEMDRLIQSNPGLASRFGHRVDFEDFSPEELGRIFMLMCGKNEYRMNGHAMSRLLVGLDWLHARRDRHFGNGRLVRNIFEKAIRHLADRIVDIPEITRDLLVQFESSDLRLPGVPDDALDNARISEVRFFVSCPHCDNRSKVNYKRLCQKVGCKKCNQVFVIQSGSPITA